MRLAPHFTLSELTKTSTRYLNVPDPCSVGNLKSVCLWILEPIRSLLNVPLIVNSAYRCSAVNRAVGGVSLSKHLEGKAVDISTKSMTVEQVNVIRDYCDNCSEITECIVHDNYVHIAI